FITSDSVFDIPALNLSAGTGNVTLTVPKGDVTDSDGDDDITAKTATVTFTGPRTQKFGSDTNPIGTNVDDLTVNTAAHGGNQFITEADSTTVTSLDAGTGAITLAGGTFNLAPSGDALGDNSTLIVNRPAVVNVASSDETIGSLAGNGTVTFMH